ncbi:MAG: cyclic nucleotide-binding domain-containing protein [Chloroflexi bacterium]|nr:cyclic nucleotide-binding domain-containing protein [Chloroflexota bacterium]
MTEDNKSLDDLISGVRASGVRARQNKPDASASKPVSTPRKGLTPLDVLALPEAHRNIITYLSHQKQATLAELQRANLNLTPTELEQALQTLKETGSIREVLIDGQIYHRVAFGGTMGRSKVCLPENIWSRLRADNLTFLQQMPLFQGIPRRKLVQVAGKLEEREYHRNEIIIKQAEPSDSVFLVKSGIVGITHLSPGAKSNQILAYLKQGDILGEIGILGNKARSATATALSEVSVLMLKRDIFLELLQKFNATALELARILGQQLVVTTNRLDQSQKAVHLVLVFRLAPGAGCTTISSALATVLARETQQATVYTEYPALQQLPTRPGLDKEAVDPYHHPGGYDVLLPYADPSLPVIADTALLIDHLLNHYTNVVIGLTSDIDDSVVYMLERASQVILVAPPEPAVWADVETLLANLKERVPKKTSLFTLINRARAEYQATPAPGPADFDIPFFDAPPTLPALDWAGSPLPEPLANVTRTIADRLERTHELGVYIPTTVDVDQAIDTTPYVEKTLAFLGELFGGATSSQAQGVWNSDEAGLVNETIHIVRAYTTRAHLNRHLDQVLDYLEGLKVELKQEAMALEVDQRLILV